MIKRISTKIILAYTILIIILSLFLFFFFNNLVRDIHLGVIKREMAEKIRVIEHLLRHEKNLFPINDREELAKSIGEISRILELRITLIDYNGTVAADSSVKNIASLDNHKYRAEIFQAMNHPTGHSIRYSNNLKTDMLYFARKSDPYLIRLAKPLFEIDESVSRINRIILLTGGLLLLLALSINIVISKIITRPINETIDFSRRFARGDFTRRIPDYSDDEIGILQKSLNDLADALADKINTLQQEQNKLEITLENISDGIVVIDRNKKIVLSNKAFSDLFQVSTRVKGVSYYEIIRSSVLNSKIEHSLLHGIPLFFEQELGGGTYCDVTINPIREEKLIQGILVVMHDITERKRIMELKTELVGNLSHELKTPVAILKGYLETIMAHPGDPELLRNSLSKALVNVDRQNSIINDMLKLNLLETTASFPFEPIDIGEVLDTCFGSLEPKVIERGLRVTREEKDIPAAVSGNRFLAEEVFYNLIDNAINYNRAGGKIIISSEITGSVLAVLISDTGIGIPRESLGRVFERFYRVDKSRSRATGGTGLGLSIVKHAAGLLGWTIQVASDANGTTFRLGIPF